MWFSYYTISDAEWCNGSTTDSDSVCRGSNPFSVVLNSRSVAQFGRALRSGRRGRRFKSCHTDRPAADIWFAAFLLQKPLIPKIGQGFFFCRFFLSGAYTKGGTDSPAHPNQFFCKQKIPYAHKNQWPVDFAH